VEGGIVGQLDTRNEARRGWSDRDRTVCLLIHGNIHFGRYDDNRHDRLRCVDANNGDGETGWIFFHERTALLGDLLLDPFSVFSSAASGGVSVLSNCRRFAGTISLEVYVAGSEDRDLVRHRMLDLIKTRRQGQVIILRHDRDGVFDVRHHRGVDLSGKRRDVDRMGRARVC